MQMRAAVDTWLWPRLVAAAVADVVAVAVVGMCSGHDESYLRSEAFLSQVRYTSPVHHLRSSIPFSMMQMISGRAVIDQL